MVLFLNLISDQTNLYAQQVLSLEAYDKSENVTQLVFWFHDLNGH